nr:MAG TPA: hypothetical protein [Caudoviricetes sp.]
MKTTNINSNANAKKFHRNYNSNTNISRDKYAKSKQIENMATKLCQMFGNEQYFAFYCKVFWKLPEATVWQLAETALEAKQTPGRLFTYLCKKAGV